MTNEDRPVVDSFLSAHEGGLVFGKPPRSETADFEEDAVYVCCTYVTMPRLHMKADRIDLSTGALVRISGEDFKTLDPDYFDEPSFERIQPVFWHSTDTFTNDMALVEATSDEYGSIRTCYLYHPKATLLYNALICSAALNFTDPGVSTAYIIRGRISAKRIHNGVVYPRHIDINSSDKRIGITGRLFILNDEGYASLNDEDMQCVTNLYEKLDKADFPPDHFLFRAVRTMRIGDVSNKSQFSTALVCAVVAVEGLLLGTPTKGVTKAMERRIEELIPASMNIDVKHIVRSAYDYRSNLLHGRLDELPDEYDKLYYEFSHLVRTLTRSVADRMIARGLVRTTSTRELQRAWE